jgi:hypothetical protein
MRGMNATGRRAILAIANTRGAASPPPPSGGRWPSLRGRRGSWAQHRCGYRSKRPSGRPPPALASLGHLPRWKRGREMSGTLLSCSHKGEAVSSRLFTAAPVENRCHCVRAGVIHACRKNRRSSGSDCVLFHLLADERKPVHEVDPACDGVIVAFGDKRNISLGGTEQIYELSRRPDQPNG